MSRLMILPILMLAAPAIALQEAVDAPPGAPFHAPIDYAPVIAEIDANMERLGLAPAELSRAGADRDSYDRLIYPVQARPNADLFRPQFIGNFVDLNPAGPFERLDYACGARTYDLNSGYDHAGTDISTAAFRAHAMNQRWVEVVAAAGGVIIARNDTAPDRNCGGLGANQNANYVSILQDDGLTAHYWHLALRSLTERQVGERVEAGDYLGLVGSSGISTAPHLHFELWDADRNIVDPFAGACGADSTLWRHQHDYLDPAITALYTHNFTPQNVSGSFCQPEYPRFRDTFAPGDTIHLGLYVRDRGVGAVSSIALLDQSGTPVFSEDFAAATDFAAVADYQTRFTLPADAPPGQWTIRAEYQGDERERAVYVGSGPEPGARLAAATLPASRSVVSGSAATVFASVLNPSAVTATGCWITLDSPFAGRFAYRETDPASNAVIGEVNALFNLPPGGARSFVLSLTPHADAMARGHDQRLRFKCTNSDAAAVISGLNSVLLSFGSTPSSDLIAIAITPSGDGVLRLADADAGAAFATAMVNVGANGTLSLQPQGAGAATTLRLRICETDPVSGVCLAPPAETLSRTFAPNETASVAVFARGQGEAVPFAPATARIRVEARDAGGTVRGATSVAVRTD